MNYKEILSKIKILLGWWKQRDLTLAGKIQLLKVFALSKLTYVSSVMPVPAWVYKEIEKVCFDFIWRGQDKIKRNIMYLDYNQGGLKMLHFKDMIKVQRVMWIKRLLLGEGEMKWKEYFEYIFQSIGGKFIFLCNYDMHDIYVQAPPLYLEYLRIWQDMKENRVVIKDPENQIFYNNTLIRFGRKTIFNRNIF